MQSEPSGSLFCFCQRRCFSHQVQLVPIKKFPRHFLSFFYTQCSGKRHLLTGTFFTDDCETLD